MFKVVFSKTYDEYAYAKYNIEPIVEDCYRIDNNIFCVADGVTMDLKTGEFTPYPSSKEQAEYVINNYPNPSGAYMAANICCENFIQYTKEIDNKTINKDVIKSIVNRVNKDIWGINKDRKIDYAPNDFYCCVAAGGIIKDNKLFCFSIGDTNISLFDEHYNKIFTTRDNVNEVIAYIDNNIFGNSNLEWSSQIRRQKTRKNYRNNPKSIIDGKIMSYGALTGEVTAMDFVNLYEVDLSKVKYILAYSDGFKPFLKNSNDVKHVIENPSHLKYIGNEKTLVIYENVNSNNE